MTQDLDPQEALASIRAARAGVGQTLEYPFAWDLAYGAILGVMVGGAGFPQPWSTVTLVLSLVALAFLVRWWRSRVGWWVNGYSPPRARWIAFGMVGVLMALMSLSYWTRRFDGPVWAPLLAGALASVTGVIGGRLWMRAYRRDLLEGS